MERILHDWRIEEREYQRHEQRRGPRHAFTTVAPQRTALIVIDMVPFFYRRGVRMNIDGSGVVPGWLSERARGSPTQCSRPGETARILAYLGLLAGLRSNDTGHQAVARHVLNGRSRLRRGLRPPLRYRFH